MGEVQNGQRQILVHEHRDFKEAGIQVPAGTVEENESVKTALFREIDEEAGIHKERLKLKEKVAEYRYDDPSSKKIHNRHIYHLEAIDELPHQFTCTVRGDGEDAGLVFEYRWMELEVAKALLVGEQGECIDKLGCLLKVNR